MPYWSLEDWRKCIGLSWSAIGCKPKRSKHRKSEVVTTQASSNNLPLLGILTLSLLVCSAVCWNFRKLCNGVEFYTDTCTSTTDHQISFWWSCCVLSGIPATFKLVWSKNQDGHPLPPCFVPLSTDVMIILLRCGDVEVNPGPNTKSK